MKINDLLIRKSKTNQSIFIRTFYNSAINDRIIKEIKIGSGKKIGLTALEIEKIETIELTEDTSFFQTQNIRLFAFYFAEIRILDEIKLKWSDFKDGRHLFVAK